MTILRYTWEFRSILEFECIRDDWRDWLHGDQTFRAFLTPELAVADARRKLEEDLAGREPDDQAQIVTWSRTGDNHHEYTDGGIWYELSDGEEGRVVIHKIELVL